MPRPRSGQKEPKPERSGDLFGSDVACDLLYFEDRARASGFSLIAGLDEAGRGPLAGPVVAAAVMLPEGLLIPGLNDSKQVSEPERERLFEVIRNHAISFGVGIVDVETIDDVNIYQSTIIAMEKALDLLTPPPDYLLLDAITLPRIPVPQKPLVKGDCRSNSIAAASILAKVTRDRLMRELHGKYPQYNFDKHKGYCTKEHLTLLKKHGPCAAHRKSFGPVADLLGNGAG